MATSDVTVLLVEDEPAILDSFEMVLEERYDVRTAHDGEEALARIDDTVDVVLLDRMMPGMSGGEVLEEIRERDVDPRIVLETLTGDVQPDLEPVDLSKTIRDEIGRLRSAYPEATFETDLDGEVTVVANDLLEEVVGNVLRNALVHNDTDDLSVSATVEAAPSTVTVRIADDGSGIPDEDKEAVFRRGETGHVKKTGSGFGLFFVDAMVSAYGGDVWIADNEPSGSTFVIELAAA